MGSHVLVHQHGTTANSKLLGSTWATRPVQGQMESAKQDESDQVVVVSAHDYVAVYAVDVVEGCLCLKTWTVGSADGANERARTQGKVGRKGIGERLESNAHVLPGTGTLVALASDGTMVAWEYFQESLHLKAKGGVRLGEAKAKGLTTGKRLKGCAVVAFEDGAVAMVNEKMVVARLGYQGPEIKQVVSVDLMEAAGGKANRMDLLATSIVTDDNGVEQVYVRMIAVNQQSFREVGAHYCGELNGRSLVGVVAHSSHLITIFWSDRSEQVLYLHRTSNLEVIAEGQAEALEVTFNESTSSASPSGKRQRKRGRAESVASHASVQEGSIVDGGIPMCSVQSESAVLLFGCKDRVVIFDAKLGVATGENMLDSTPQFLNFNKKRSMLSVGLANGDVCVIDCSSSSSSSLRNVSARSTLASALQRKIRLNPAQTDISGALLACPTIVDLVEDAAFQPQKWTDRFEKNSQKASKDLETLLSPETPFEKRTRILLKNEASFNFKSVVVETLLKNEEWALLRFMFEQKQVSVKSHPDLLQGLIDHGQVELLFLAIRQVDDLDEVSMLLILRYICSEAPTAALAKVAKQLEDTILTVEQKSLLHSNKKKKFDKRGQSIFCAKSKEEATDRQNKVITWLKTSFSDEERCIHYFVMATLLAPKNSVFVIDAGKRFNFVLVKCLLLTLSNLITFYDSLPMRENPCLTIDATAALSLPIPGLNLCLSWFAMLLDSSFMRIAEQGDSELLGALKAMQTLSMKHSTMLDWLQRTQYPLLYATNAEESMNYLSNTPLGDYAVESILL